MTPLTQQLEDKKKGCGVDIGGVPCGEFIARTEDEDGREWGKTYYCKTCQAEIAILEQAIAEMQKQRQEILDIIDKKIEYEKDFFKEGFKCRTSIKLLEDIKEQLNQPKTEE